MAAGFQPLPGMTETPRPGVSLVTCCMNRNANLLRALPSWLAQEGITEIVVVDWSSTDPVAGSLARAGIDDPRIRVARVEGEPRWILSWAFNIGFRLAGCETILKADADIVLEPGFLAANPLAPGRFIAGNWRTAGKGQEFVNGFFVAHQADLRRVNGFNEFITTYGWDDDDIYNRLADSGLARVDVAPGTVRHLDHDDAARMGAGDDARNGWDDLHAQTMFKIRTNRLIATLMPAWGPRRAMIPCAVTPLPGGWRLHRDGPPPHPVPPHIRRTAERMAAYELVHWRAGPRTYDLPEPALDLLLDCRRLHTITALHVELLLAGAGVAAMAAARHLVVKCARPPEPAELAAYRALAEETGRCLVVLRHDLNRPDDLLPHAAPPAPLAVIPNIRGLGRLMPLDRIEEVREADPGTQILHVPLDPEPEEEEDGPAAPAIATGRRDRLWIDAQHGLGNRLRAIGSAAAIARATDRELIVIWEPDHHCEGRFSDLFAPAGLAVEEEEGFLDRARADGATVLNYMEIEPGAAKGAPLSLVPGRDAYLRSAYVINHPASHWDSENVLLRGLRPSAPVEALMAGVPDHRDIGLHVRMEGMPGTDTNSYDRAENWTAEGHAAIHHWRSASHFSRFMARLDTLIAEAPDARIFLAADMPETYRAFGETYGARVAWLERGLYDRSAAQLQYALADILLLARCRHFLGSNWSSFSELALRLSSTIAQSERSGVDF